MAYNRLMPSACCLRRSWRDPLERVDSFFHSLLGSVPVRRAFLIPTQVIRFKSWMRAQSLGWASRLCRVVLEISSPHSNPWEKPCKVLCRDDPW